MYITRVFRVLGFGRRLRGSAVAAAATATAVIGKDARRERKNNASASTRLYMREYNIIIRETQFIFVVDLREFTCPS